MASPTFFQADVLAFRVSILWWHFLGSQLTSCHKSSHGDTKISPWFIPSIYPWEFQDTWRLYIWYPLVNIQIAIENDNRNSGFTPKKIVISHSYVSLPKGRLSWNRHWWNGDFIPETSRSLSDAYHHSRDMGQRSFWFILKTKQLTYDLTIPNIWQSI